MANWTCFCPRQISNYRFCTYLLKIAILAKSGRLDLIVLDVRYRRLVNILFPFGMFTLVLCLLTCLFELATVYSYYVYLLRWCFEIRDWICVSKGCVGIKRLVLLLVYFLHSCSNLITDLVSYVVSLGGSDTLNMASERQSSLCSIMIRPQFYCCTIHSVGRQSMTTGQLTRRCSN